MVQHINRTLHPYETMTSSADRHLAGDSGVICMTFRLFSEKKKIANPVIVFVLTLLLCSLGSNMRLPMVLSLFWIVNAIIAGLFLRKPWLHTLPNYLACYAGMVANDFLFSGWAMASFSVNLANIIFIFITVMLLSRLPPYQTGQANIRNVMMILPICLLAALVSGCWGAIFSTGITDGQVFWVTLSAWTSEQFSTGILLLPLMLTFTLKNNYQWRFSSLLPLGTVIFLLMMAVMFGGPGSLSIPLPGLIWCALILPLSLTCLITCLIGAIEIILIYMNIIRVGSGFIHSDLTPLVSIRLGIAALALAPYMVALSMDAIRKLNSQLAIRANYDFLTRLLSRAGLFDSLSSQPFIRNGTLGLILLDVDFFKSINDNYGHDGGDQVLREIGQRLNKQIQPHERLSRFGGEEFALVIFGCDEAYLYVRAEALRQCVAATPFALSQGAINVTVSLGTAVEIADCDNSWITVMNRLVTRADKNLYISKRNGRNKTSPAWLEIGQAGVVSL